MTWNDVQGDDGVGIGRFSWDLAIVFLYTFVLPPRVDLP
jgi:hypothetical protein